MSDPKSRYEHDGIVLQDGHVDPVTGPRCMVQMREGPSLGLYVIGHTGDVLAEGTPVWRDFITGRARKATHP